VAFTQEQIFDRFRPLLELLFEFVEVLVNSSCYLERVTGIVFLVFATDDTDFYKFVKKSVPIREIHGKEIGSMCANTVRWQLGLVVGFPWESRGCCRLSTLRREPR
jgi:hypothetical protein